MRSAPAAKAIVAPEPKFAERVLCGHSGAHVVLHSSGGEAFVRKTAPDTRASSRLIAQADKQHALWMFGLPFPKVRSQSVSAEGIASFDMAYIPGRTIADAVMKGASFAPDGLVKAIGRLMRLFALAARGAHAPALFERKIEDIAAKMAACALAGDVRDCAQSLMARDWSGIPDTQSHGDLTLENILLTAGRSIAFIDCDETFASSFWLDFGKLFQDVEGHWCIRALYAEGAAPVARLNAIQKLEQLGRELRLLAMEIDPALPARLSQLAGLSLFRALPYAKSKETLDFICRRTRRLLER